MKRILMSLVLTLSASAASAQIVIREDHNHGSRGNYQVAYLADQLASSLDSLSDVLARRFYNLPVAREAQQVAQAARSFAYSAQYSDVYALQQSFGWLKQQFDDLDYSIQNYGCNYDQQVNSWLNRARHQIESLERLVYQVGPFPGPGPGPDPFPGPGPGPGPFPPPGPIGQNWVCQAVDNGWEEHGQNAHPGYGRNQWEAQQSAIYNCERVHGTCNVSNCRVVR